MFKHRRVKHHVEIQVLGEREWRWKVFLGFGVAVRIEVVARRH